MQISLQDRRALVTGANSGIGAAIASALGEAGARVAINYVTDEPAAEQVAAAIRRRGGDALLVRADVTQPDAVAALFQHLDSAFGGLDILVNNAGVDGDRSLSWETDLARWRTVLEVNLVGAFYCAREALRRMTGQRSGVILNLTSVHEAIAWSGYSAYTASKAGLAMLSKTLAQEAAPYGVRVLALAPGAIRTPINQTVWGDPQMLADLLRKIPLGRLGTVDEVARLAVVLVSDVASYVTGTTVYVDGGMTDYPAFRHGG